MRNYAEKLISEHSLLLTGHEVEGGEGEVAVVSTKRWHCRNWEDLIESPVPSHDAQVAELYLGSNPARPPVLAAKVDDYTTAPHYL